MKPRRGSTGISYRRLPKSSNNIVGTLFGTDVKVYCCSACGEVKNWSEFYYPPSYGEKYGEPIPMSECCVCNDQKRLHNAKLKRRKDNGIYVDKDTVLPNENTLAEFIL